MKIHEYQAKELFRQFNVPVPNGVLAETVFDAVAGGEKLGLPVVVKAQIHAGGRGQGGGIKLVKTPEELKAAADFILGMQLVTHQTGPAGKRVQKVWVEKATNIEKEFYLGVVLDRAKSQMVMMASQEGGLV